MRLIDADEIYEFARTSGLHGDFARSRADLTSLRELLEDCDTVDAAPVVHAGWVRGHLLSDPHTQRHFCSACLMEPLEEVDGCVVVDFLPNYCPNCGAKMDL